MGMGIGNHLRGRKITLGMHGLTIRCHCGFVITYQNENLGCIDCGEACCPACAFTSEGVVYCATCAREQYGLASRANTGQGWGLTYFVPAWWEGEGVRPADRGVAI